ncbi:putative copper resistance protein D [Actinacidiphila yanglinensis]|uniref:Putative copper resistance protein D n=1 Tax=Actinacidiphila yanglinensis TaxID=310779 RepID=A0A1H5TVF1_9ACTN|nr:cytochrome c oxidase assembly protein [Actinacidiphila yanglinensis]SEF66021.1 putative copper resistance protein D [Actinacidiphila yanglinensis]
MATTAAAPGFQALPELTGSRFLGTWQLDGVALAAVLLLGAAYGYGVRRKLASGERWPLWRVAAFYVFGLGTLVFATMSALAVYDRVLFWPAAVQNILLDLFAPLGLALGDPIGLAAPGSRLRRAFSSRPVRVLTYPLISSVLVLVSELTIYFTPYFPHALADGSVRQLMHLQLLLTGCLFVLPMLSRQELLPRWCSHPVRAILVFLDGLFDSVPGIVVMTSGTLVAGDWYRAHPRTWGPSVKGDQMLGGGLMLTLAEVVGLPFLLLVFMEWWRAEREKTAALDAALDREAALSAPATPRTAAPTVPAPGTASSAPPPVAAEPPTMTRPWWETDEGEVGMRMRNQR